MNQKLAAELFGTFTLSLVVLLSVNGIFPIPTPVLASLVLLLFVYSIGSVSGCHINPAVTLGLVSLKKIDPKIALTYIAAQVMGGFLAFLVFYAMNLNHTPVVSATTQNLVFELIGMIIFTFGIGAVVLGKVRDSLSGIMVGGSLLLGISISAMGGAAGILNPAVGLSLQVFQVGYYLVQIVGGIVGFYFAHYIFSGKK